MKRWFIFTVLISISAFSMSGNILTVPSVSYPTIQSAIDAATATDTVVVSQGIYYEKLDTGGKAITLCSTDPNDPDVVAGTIIDGGASGTVITCDTNETADMVIKGFWIQNGTGNSSTGNGGGIYCDSTYPIIENCVFSSNAATGGYGGGIFCWQGAPTISNCTFIGNSIGLFGNGGGIACYGSDSIVTNCVFSGNDAPVRGGGLYCNQSNPTVTNCTFSQNTAEEQGGAIYCTESDPIVVNCIMWGDSADSGDEVYSSVSSPTVSYCVIEGGWTGTGSNNIDSDPLFVDADGADDTVGTADDDLYPDPFSLCINAGDPNGDYWTQKDKSGYSRILYGRVDIGAYEVFPVGGDLNEDGQVDLADLILFADSDSWLVDVDLVDFALFAGQWMLGVGDFIPGDLNEDGQVDLADLILFVGSDNWLVEDNLVDFAVLAKHWMLGVE